MNYNTFPQFIFRSPLMPISSLRKILQNKENILSFISEPIIKEAIYIASPSLYNEIEKLQLGKVKDDKEVDRIISSVTRYIIRLSTRCTPFGLFAGCGVGIIDIQSKIVINHKKFQRNSRLDMQYLYSLIDTILRDDNIKKHINYLKNTSLYQVGRKSRYVECINIFSQKSYRIAEFDNNKQLNSLLNIVNKKVSTEILINKLVELDISRDNASDFISSIIDASIIQNELSNTVTGEDLLDRLIKLLTNINSNIEYTRQLKDLSNQIKNLDKNINEISTYNRIIQLIKDIKIPFETNTLFQVDMMHTVTDASIGKDIINEVKQTVYFLNKITPPSKNNIMDLFINKFIDRYDKQEVALLEALDPEVGIGYPINESDGDPSPLIDNLVLPPKNNPTTYSLGNLQSILLSKTLACRAKNENEIILTDDDFQSNLITQDLPSSLACMIEIINTANDKPQIILKSAGGSSGANLLSRFAYLDKNIENLVKRITKQEQLISSNKILAEIVYLPESRIGNVLYRPHIREYELLLMSSSDLSEKKTIPVSDLMISFRDNRLILRSKKLNKEILPRLTTAHNYRNNKFPIYRFLCDMQFQQNKMSVYFTWGELQNELTFRPRVRYNNTILSEAGWSININEIKYLFKLNIDNDIIKECDKWRNSISLPQYVFLVDGDNKLFVDWSSILCIKSLFSIIKNRISIEFKEFLFNEDNSLIINKEGLPHLNECIVIFYKEKDERTKK